MRFGIPWASAHGVCAERSMHGMQRPRVYSQGDDKDKQMKKIMALVLSIAVIFSFAACEAGTIPSYYGKTVVSVTLANTPDYLKGETLNPADITLRVVYDDNTETTFTGAELGLKPGYDTHEKDSYLLAAPTNYFSVVYGTNRDGKQVVDNVNDYVWPIQILATDVANVKIAVDPSNADDEIAIGGTISDVDLSGLAYTVEFPNGNTKAIDINKLNDDYVTWPVTASVFELDGTTEEEGEVSVVVKDTIENITLTSAWTLSVVSDEDPIDESTIEFVINDDYEIFEHGTGTGKTNTLADIVDNSTIVAKTVSGDDADFSDAEVTFDLYEDTVTAQEYGNRYNVAITLGEETYKATLSFEWTTDYPTSVTVAQADPDKTYSEKQTVRPEDFTYSKFVWASGYEDYSEADEQRLGGADHFTILNDKILVGEQSTTSTVSHSIEIIWTDEALQDKITISAPKSVNVAKG